MRPKRALPDANGRGSPLHAVTEVELRRGGAAERDGPSRARLRSADEAVTKAVRKTAKSLATFA
jgi:hypothetical protein